MVYPLGLCHTGGSAAGATGRFSEMQLPLSLMDVTPSVQPALTYIFFNVFCIICQEITK